MNRARLTTHGLILLGGLLLASCGGEPPASPPVEGAVAPEAPAAPGLLGPQAALAPPADYAAVHGGRDFAAEVELTPDPLAGARPLRRLSVKQLREAIANATGGLAWRDAAGNDKLEQLAPTLGVPNYIDTTSEDQEASLVFQKFLGDGVREVCTEAIQNDLDMAASDRVLVREVDPLLTWEVATPEQQQAIDRNLRYMKLRITGLSIGESDEEELGRLRWLFRSVTHATGSPEKGWRAVCVGLMASPEFYLY